MFLNTCYTIKIKHREFMDKMIDGQFLYSYSEIVRHAVLLLMTVRDKIGYIPCDLYQYRDLSAFKTMKQSSKFPRAFLEKMNDIVTENETNRSVLIIAALDHLMEWMEGEIAYSQEVYIITSTLDDWLRNTLDEIAGSVE